MDILNCTLSILALTLLEVILGIDNLVFLSILTERLPKSERKSARRWGLTFAWVTRILLLATATQIVGLTKPWFVFAGFLVAPKNIFLLIGGMFLITKATQEIHAEMMNFEEEVKLYPKSTLTKVVTQVAVMDIVFSLDSVLTAVGLTSNFFIMCMAITVAILVMIYASEPVGHFIETHPTIKMLALSFLILIGMLLVADSFEFHVPRGYLYFAMAFSLMVEALNFIRRAKHVRSKSKNTTD